MKQFFLLVILMICAGAYFRAQQPAFWNLCLKKLQVPRTSGAYVLADANGPASFASTFSTSYPLPVTSTVTTDTIVVHSEEEADFLNQLNSEGTEISQKVDAMLARNGNAGKEAWEALDAQVVDYERKAICSPLTVNQGQFRNNILENRKAELQVVSNSPSDFGRHRVLVQEFLADPFPEVVALGRREANPIDLQYTATDGSAVDLGRLRGKVVLVDFWAAWCTYCREETPLIVAAYQKYHSQGLEILGVSWDDQQNLMTSFTQNNGMPWPQYFYPDHLGNPISRKFDVGTLPTLWLIDKHGCLVNATCGHDLDTQLPMALAEP